MKTIITIIVVILVGLGIWSVTRDSVEPVVVDQGTASSTPLTDGSYMADTSASSLTWQGSKILVPGYKDVGTIMVSAGQFTVADGKIATGTFTIDMDSIEVSTTSKGSDSDKLVTHLKSDDFFDVEQYPTSKFVITRTVHNADGTVTVTGDLTIKGKTNSITMPVIAVQNGTIVTVTGSTELDRTLWDVRYGSGKFFEDLGDKVIDDKFMITLNIVSSQATSTAAI